MNEALPKVYLVRHGETAWSSNGQHTGCTDIPLTQRGEHAAQELSARLKGLSFAKVFTSPLQRARRMGGETPVAVATRADRALEDTVLMLGLAGVRRVADGLIY